MKTRQPVLILVIILSFLASAQAQQTIPDNPIATRFVNGWKLQRIQTADGLQDQVPAVEFRMIVTADGILQQGLYPEGLFESQWKFDVLRMQIYMSDFRTNASYTLHILKLTRNQLVLEAVERNERTLMYYTLIR